jgi:hypothetical protein
MEKWKRKALLQKTVSFLPGRIWINYFFQRHLTKGLRAESAFFDEKIMLAAKHLAIFRNTNGSLPETTLEIGTGWFPVVPVVFWLCGVQNIVTYDHYPHLKTTLLRETIHYLKQPEMIAKLERLPGFRKDRLEKLMAMPLQTLTVSELHPLFSIRYLSGKKALENRSPLKANLIHSNNTFAHIYSAELTCLLQQSNRHLAEHGIHSHQIDLCDHFAYFDREIPLFHFLRFTDNRWKRIDNPLQAQSRNRIGDYRKLFCNSGLFIQEEQVSKAAKTALPLIIDQRFLSEDPDELTIKEVHFTLVTRLPSSSLE